MISLSLSLPRRCKLQVDAANFQEKRPSYSHHRIYLYVTRYPTSKPSHTRKHLQSSMRRCYYAFPVLHPSTSVHRNTEHHAIAWRSSENISEEEHDDRRSLWPPHGSDRSPTRVPADVDCHSTSSEALLQSQVIRTYICGRCGPCSSPKTE